MHRRTFLLVPFALAACQESSPAPRFELAQAAERLQTFDARRPVPATARQVFVLFDTQCKYCAQLWRAAEPLTQRVRFRWAPVALLSRASLEQGAFILGAPDPAAAMSEHEKLLAGPRRGISVHDVDDGKRQAVQENTAVFRAIGATQVPMLLWRDREGSWRSATGALGTEQLRTLLQL